MSRKASSGRRVNADHGEALSFSATMRAGTLRKIDFYRLPRPVQDRFAASTRRTAPPAPLLFRAAPRTTAWASLGGSAVLVIVASLLLRAGSGDVTSPLALHGIKMLAVDVILFAAASYGVVHAMAILRALDSAPYRPGMYLFPACVVDARDSAFRVWSVADADAVEVVSAPSPGLALRMPGGTRVTVPASSLEEAQRAEMELASLKEDLMRAVAEGNPHLLAELDPLHDNAMSSPIGPTESMRNLVPLWIRLDWAVAAAMGLALGLVLGETRNSVSDKAMYQAITSAATSAAYEQYLAQGGRHSEEVRDVLLPRVALAEAESQGTVEAVQEFAAAHAGSRIGPEIDAAMRRALLAQLDKAKRAGTVAALDEFNRKYPDSKLEPELKAARHALFVQALAAWKKKTTPAAAAGPFVERLLAFAEKSGSPTCEIRFRPRPSKSMDEADDKVMKSGHFPGPDALPSIYVTTNAMRPRERRVAQDIAQGFAANFPTDILAMRAGDPLAPDAPAPSAVPTLVVEYDPEWSRSNAVSVKPHTVFANLIFVFDTSFALPDGAPPLKSSMRLWRGAELWRLKSDGLTREEYQQQVYDTMIDGAFDQLEKRLLDTFF
jgi:hypothetical protein